MTYNVFSGTLNSAQSINQSINPPYFKRAATLPCEMWHSSDPQLPTVRFLLHGVGRQSFSVAVPFFGGKDWNVRGEEVEWATFPAWKAAWKATGAADRWKCRQVEWKARGVLQSNARRRPSRVVDTAQRACAG